MINGILQVEDGEITINQNRNEIARFYKIGTSKNKVSYILIQINFDFKSLEDCKKFKKSNFYSEYLHKLEVTINQTNILNQEEAEINLKNSDKTDKCDYIYNTCKFLQYFGVYNNPGDQKYYLVFEKPKFTLTEIQGNLLIRKESFRSLLLFLKLCETKRILDNIDSEMIQHLFFVDKSGNFRILYLGEYLQVPRIENNVSSNFSNTSNYLFPTLINKNSSFESMSKNNLYYFYKIFLFIETHNLYYLNNKNFLPIVNDIQKLPVKYQKLVGYFIELLNCNKFDNLTQEILSEYTSLFLVSKNCTHFNLLKEKKVSIVSKRVENKFFFDQIFYTLGLFNRKSLNSPQICIDISVDDENMRSITSIIPKLFSPMRIKTYSEEVECNKNSSESINQVEEDQWNSKCESEINEDCTTNKSHPNEAMLNFMYKNFPHENENISETIYFKDYTEYLINSIDKKKLPIKCIDYYGYQNAKEKKLSIRINHLYEFKHKINSDQDKNETRYLEYKQLRECSEMVNIWTYSNTSEEICKYPCDHGIFYFI
jgi:hypothetical protein